MSQTFDDRFRCGSASGFTAATQDSVPVPVAFLNDNGYRFFMQVLHLLDARLAVVRLPVAALLVGATLAGCTSGDKVAAPAECPGGPVDVVVSVDQWGDVVSELGGDCATVKTLLASSSVDPHDYEPSPADAAAFTGARLVVVNGAGYDRWASDLARTSASGVPVVDAAQVSGTPDGANPHLWYKPTAVTAVADAVSSALEKLNPEAADYFAKRRTAFAEALRPYDSLTGKIKAAAAGKSYAATESVFDYQAEALGLINKTPQGYQQAAANETDPSPADIRAFQAALAARDVDVLIFNTQTEGSVTQQLREAAEKAGVPVVDVTETVPPGQDSFVDWQDEQLAALAKALGVQV